MSTVNTTRHLTGAQAVMACLEAEGVELMFGYPGGSAIALYDAYYDVKNIDHVLVRHEQAAVHAADGYARATGKTGVVMVTSGPGATNTVTGIMTAYMDSVPLIIISGQVATKLIGTDAFQETDITGVTLPIVKHSYLIKDIEDLPRIFKEAFHIASTGRPGPVLIDIPSDIQKASFEFSYPEKIHIPSYKPTYRGHYGQIKQAAQCLAKAERPLLLIGGGTVSSGAHSEIKELAEMIPCPVVHTLMAKGCLSDYHPLNLHMLGMHGTIAANWAVNHADVIMAVGMRFDDRVTMKLEAFASQAKIIHVDIDPAEISKNIDPAVPLVGDAKTVISSIIHELKKQQYQPSASTWVDACKQQQREHPLSYDDSNPDSIPPQKLIERLQEQAQALAQDLYITTEVGQHQMWAAQFCHCEQPRHFITSGGGGTMGFGLPAALGALMGRPEACVVCIAGDGSLQMNIQEMATIAERNLPVKVLLVNNSCLGMVCQWQEIIWQGRISQTTFPRNIPDFCMLAHAYGWWSKELSNPRDMDGLLREFLEHKGPALLNVRTAERELVLPMILPGKSLMEPLDMQPRPAYSKKEQ